MHYFKFTIESKSNKQLDTFAAQVVKAIICKKSGPIPSKGKRIVYAYNYDSTTVSNLIKLKTPKKVKVTLEDLTHQESNLL